MNRSLKLPLLIALALGSTQLLAVDLGQIQVKSALGQPLLAEIPVHAATPAELQHLTAQLASSDDFARAGIAGGRTTIPLHFSVADAAGGQRVIRITSAVAVEDPYLDLLIEVHAQAGKSVREFTILLDPPGAPVAAAPVSARQAQPVARTCSARGWRLGDTGRCSCRWQTRLGDGDARADVVLHRAQRGAGRCRYPSDVAGHQAGQPRGVLPRQHQCPEDRRHPAHAFGDRSANDGRRCRNRRGAPPEWRLECEQGSQPGDRGRYRDARIGFQCTDACRYRYE